MNINIYSQNATYQKFQVLKENRNKRFKYGEFIVEGVRNINKAIENGWEISSFIYSNEMELSDWAKNILCNVKTEVNYCLTYALLQLLSGKQDTSEIMAIIKMRKSSINNVKLSKKPMILLFDRPSNKGNLGAIIRSCDAFGVDMLITTGHSVDIYDPEVVVSTMGSFFNMQVYHINDNNTILQFIESLREKHSDLSIIATTAHKQSAIYDEDISGPCILMIGNETEGLCKNLYNIANKTVTIPMVNGSAASSFNVACAATTMMYEITRQRSKKEK